MGGITQERAAFATWLASQHLRFDSRLTQVVFLPDAAPENEVRLLEINTGLYPESGNPIIPVETTPAVADLPFHVWIADVSPKDWERIQADPALLPAGWSLQGNSISRRKQ